METKERDAAGMAAPEQDWHSAEKTVSPGYTAEELIREDATRNTSQQDWRTAEGKSYRNDVAGTETDEKEQKRIYVNQKDDSDDDPDPDDDNDDNDDEAGDWGHVDPAEGNSPFPDPMDPSAPGSAV